MLIFKEFTSVISNYDVFIFDFWGVLFQEGIVYPNVVDLVNNLTKHKKVFLMSNTPHTAVHMHELIKMYNFNLEINAIITAGQVANSIIENSGIYLNIDIPNVYHVGDCQNSLLRKCTYKIVNKINDANIALLTMSLDETDNLYKFDNILRYIADHNIVSVCANPDVEAPYELQTKKYCAGYFAKKIEKLGGRVVYSGKPHSIIYDKCELDISKHRILMIGDSLETDIAGANRYGIDSALVLTGNIKKVHANCNSIYDKLQQINLFANKMQIVPTFVTTITEQY